MAGLLRGALTLLCGTMASGCCMGGGAGSVTEPARCEGEAVLDRGPTGDLVLSGEVRGAPGARVDLPGVSEVPEVGPDGRVSLSLPVGDDFRSDSEVRIACNTMGQGFVQGVLRVTRVPRFVQREGTELTCESALCQFIGTRTGATVRAPAGARVTVGDQTLVAPPAGEARVPMDPLALLQGVSLPDPTSSQLFGPSALVRAVSVQVGEHPAEVGHLTWSNSEVLAAYGTLFTEATHAPVTFPTEGHHAAGLLFRDEIGSPWFAVGQVHRPGDVGFVGVLTSQPERTSSCGTYTTGTTTVTLDRVMTDGRVVVYDRLTGREVASHVIEAPTPRCARELSSTLELTAMFDPADASRWFTSWVTSRAGGHLPTSTPDPLPTLPPLPPRGVVPDAPAGEPAGEAASEPAAVPDGTAATEMNPRVASLGYRVAGATRITDGSSGALERDFTLEHDEKMSISVTMMDYARDLRPSGRARSRLSARSVITVEPEEGTTLSDADVDAALAITATSADGLRSALTRLGWRSADPIEPMEGAFGDQLLIAVVDRGPDDATEMLAVTVSDFRGIPQGGDDPRAYRVQGSVLFVAQGGDSRGELDRVLAALAR